jgi:type I restriction enzyme S subunit
MVKLEKYSSYKNSGVEWLGEIPEHWEIIKLKFLLKEKVSDGPHETPTFIDEGVPFLSVDGIQDGELTFEKCRYVSEKDHNLYSKKANVTKGSILMGKAASTGKIAQVKVNFPFSIWSPLALIKPNEQISSSILEYYLKSHYSQIQIDWFCNINTQKNIGMGDIPKILVVLPPQEEQTKIASFLDSKTAQIDEVISQKEKLIELLKERKQIVINDAVTKGLDKNVEFVDSGVEWIGKIPKHWNIEKGKRLFQQMKRPVREQDEIVTCFRDGEVTLRTNRRTDGFTNALKEHGYQGIRKGDFIIHNMDAFAGAIGISDSDGKSTPVYSVCRPWDESIVFSKYYARYLRNLALQDFILSLAKGIRERSTDFRFKDFGELEYPLPPKDEQIQIVEYIENQTSKIDKAIELQQNYISKLKEYKASLIDSVVTGKVRVV